MEAEEFEGRVYVDPDFLSFERYPVRAREESYLLCLDVDREMFV